MLSDKEAMLNDMKKSKALCMATIALCKAILIEDEDEAFSMVERLAILAGLDELTRVVKDQFGTI